jgi:hypothetical protein
MHLSAWQLMVSYKFHSALNEIDANMYLGIWLYIAGKTQGKNQATGLALPAQL